MTKLIEDHPVGLFFLPTIILLLVIVIVPTGFMYYVSFTDFELGDKWADHDLIGVDNFTHILSRGGFWDSAIRSIVFLVVAVVVQTVLGFSIAQLLYSIEFKWKSVVMSLLVIPMSMTPVVVALIWRLMLNYNIGVINYILNLFFGFKVNWLANPVLAPISVLITDTWEWTPFIVLILYAGLGTVPRKTIEAARIDGASGWQVIRYIVVPQLKPIIILAGLLRGIDVMKFSEFDIPYIMTRGGPGSATEFLSISIDRIGFGTTGKIGRGSAIAVMLLIIIILLSLFLLRYLRREYEAE